MVMDPAHVQSRQELQSICYITALSSVSFLTITMWTMTDEVSIPFTKEQLKNLDNTFAKK